MLHNQIENRQLINRPGWEGITWTFPVPIVHAKTIFKLEPHQEFLFERLRLGGFENPLGACQCRIRDKVYVSIAPLEQRTYELAPASLLITSDIEIEFFHLGMGQIEYTQATYAFLSGYLYRRAHPIP